MDFIWTGGYPFFDMIMSIKKSEGKRMAGVYGYNPYQFYPQGQQMQYQSPQTYIEVLRKALELGFFKNKEEN